MAPRVSIGLAVYNGQRYLAEAVDSVLAQTCADLELIVSDNASTDATESICRARAAGDQRLRYYRNRQNLGAAKNFNRAFALSRGEYFKWMAADDVLAPECIARCAERLDGDPAAVLAFPRVAVIDEFDNAAEKRPYRYDRLDLTSPSAGERVRQIILHLPSISIIFGLIRASALRRTPLFRPYVGADYCLLFDLALLGRFAEVPEYLARGRWHADSYGAKVGRLKRRGLREGAAEARWFDPQNRGLLVMPHWRCLWEHLLSAARSRQPPADKLGTIALLARVANWWRRELGAELHQSARRLL